MILFAKLKSKTHIKIVFKLQEDMTCVFILACMINIPAKWILRGARTREQVNET